MASYLDRRIDDLRGLRTQREIAAAAGFPKSNIISMFKKGDTQVPFDKIPALARALDADAVHLLRLALADRWPELKAVISEVLGRQLATANEAEIFLYRWRAVTRDMDPGPTARIEAAVDRLMQELAS